MYFAQRIHQHQVMIGAGLEATQILADGRPPPDLCSGTTVVIPSADNLNVAGIDQKEVQRVKDAAVSQLRSVGFRVHEEEDAKSSAKALGFILDGAGGRVHPIPEKRGKIILALKWLAKRPRITGRSLERIIGHCIHLFMLRREFLSIFRSIYDFKTANLHRRARLWKSAAAECEWASHLLVLCESDLRKPWSGHITVSDACLSGTATCAMETDPRVVQQVGQGRELWRFRSSLPSKKARDTVLALDPFKDLETALPWDAVYDPFQLNHEFQNVPREIALSADWKVMFSSRMYLKEAITVLEGRATLPSIRHKSRSIRHFGCKHLHLGDNLGMVLAFDRGRAKAIPLLFCCRRALAYSLACGTQFVHRWIPSEFNAADSPSRQWEGEGSQKTPYEESQKAKKRFVTEILYPNASRKTASDIFEKDLQEFSNCHLKPTAFYPGSESCHGSGEPKTLGEIDVKHSEGSQGQRHGGPDGKEGKASEHTEPHLEISGADHLGGNGRISGNCFGLCTKSSCVSKLLQNTSSPGSHCHTGIDSALTTFLNECFQEGMDIADGQKYLAAVMEAWPIVGKTGLGRSRRALKGWKILDPGYTRPPLAWPVISLIALTLMQQNNVVAALLVLTMFVTYIRPSEAFKLTVQDLTVSHGLGLQFAINLNAAEELETSKVGMSGEAILLDSKTISYLGSALQRLARGTPNPLSLL